MLDDTDIKQISPENISVFRGYFYCIVNRLEHKLFLDEFADVSYAENDRFYLFFVECKKARLGHERIKISQLRRNEAQRKVDVFCGTVETVIHARTARGGAQTAHFPIHAQERLF